MAIGIIDSGLGGLSVWREIVSLLPAVSTIYLGDSKNCPYGTKTEEEVFRFACTLVEHLIAQGVSFIVVACNTISVTALDRLRRNYPSVTFVGTVPAVKQAALQTKNHRIGILSTPRTAESPYQNRLIDEFLSACVVVNEGTDRLVPLVEMGQTEGVGPEEMLKEILQPFRIQKVDVLVLGCTHFPFLRPAMQRILGEKVTILDSGSAIARQVKRQLEEDTTGSTHVQTSHTLYTTGDPDEMSHLVQEMGMASLAEVKHVTL